MCGFVSQSQITRRNKHKAVTFPKDFDSTTLEEDEKFCACDSAISTNSVASVSPCNEHRRRSLPQTLQKKFSRR